MNFSHTAVLALSLFSLFSCQSNHSTSEGDHKPSATIRIKGSDTEFAMVQDLADAYMSEHPDVKIIVEGGGSNKGIEALLNNETDICNSSREIKTDEINGINRKNINPMPIMFSVDALAIITNYRVGVDSLSTQQVTEIFSGKYKNWKELGGDDLPILLFGRDASSGTRNYFEEKFLSESKPGPIKECMTNLDILNSVIHNHGAVGYVGAGFLHNKNGKPNGAIWAMPIYIDNHPALSPYQSAAVKKGEYVLTRPLYQYMNGVPSQVIQDFVLFELTRRGQEIIMKHGFFPINDYQTQINRLQGLSSVN